MSDKITVEGVQLADAGLDGLEIVDRNGHVWPLEGFVALPGETLREAIERSLPLGCYLRVKPGPQKSGDPETAAPRYG
jgi:hypothetical protein